MRRTDRRGVVLLEVLVAVAILGIAGAAMVVLAIDSGQAIHRAREESERLSNASRFLDKVALWERSDLDQRLGTRRQGPWRLRIDHPSLNLYLASLSDSVGERVLLETALFRPDIASTEVPSAFR
jgi:prepilin-type N-terminal cleavage/methylation domain-containing protein